MVRVHADRFGPDHRAQAQVTEACQQFLNGLTDMQAGVEIGSNAAEIKHAYPSLVWARLKYIRGSGYWIHYELTYRYLL